MTDAAPTFIQLKAEVESAEKKQPGATVFAIHSTARWTGHSENPDGDRTYLIEQCDSPLALRMALRRGAPEGAVKILLTPLEDHDLEEDIKIRLGRRRVLRVDPWRTLLARFQAREVDPRVRKAPWMADKLLTLASQGDCPPAPGGYLDLETAWAFLLNRGLGLSVARPDLHTVLEWSLDPDNVARFKALPEEFRDASVAWLSEYADPAIDLVLRCVRLLDRPDAVPLGLAALVMFHSNESRKLEKSVVRLEERYLGGPAAAKRDLVMRWADAAREVVKLQLTDTEQKDAILKRADAILEDVQAGPHAHLSDVSPRGLEQRLQQFGRALREAVETGGYDKVAECWGEVRSHDYAKRQAHRLERAEMAMRLVRWLRSNAHQPAPKPASFADAVQQYMEEGSFVDWARLSLRNGDPERKLSDAYALLFGKCQTVQEEKARVFAKLLQDWIAAGAKTGGAIPVEHILSRVVAPLAKQQPVLVIVMDGMSAAVFNRLASEISGRDWTLMAPDTEEQPLTGVATVPSITEYSRTSLLCGELKTGNAAVEQAGFARHADLVTASKEGKPPVLFHKSELHDAGDGGLSSDIREKVRSENQRVVGVVINAIDDHLLKGEQIDVQWSPDAIKGLSTLLYEAKLAKRVVIVVSDHGHILECGTSHAAGDGGDRWRTGDNTPEEHELVIQGGRVFGDGHAVVAPWSETVRYSMKKNGYHGGVNPQEMTAPIAVLTGGDVELAHWTERPFRAPDWWKEETFEAAGEPEAPTLFDWRQVADESDRGEDEDWIDQLMASSVFKQQKQLAGRGFPKDEAVFVDLLRRLDQNNGKMTMAALSHKLDFPPMRLPGLLAVSQRVLNVDGYEVLFHDEDSDTIELNTKLLREQFDID